ncbi:MAG TPA: DUF1194 domain-containing protein [Alphaproteobacteria bacterium]|nr:DUF1194 domain-containing protein [Alphaproteobacteria bacterium]
MRRPIAIVVAFLFALCGATAHAEEAAPVDVQLVLAIDSSSSVTMDEYYLQLEGYAAAFKHPDLLKAIQSGPQRAVAVALFEWSGPSQQVVNFEWRILRDEASVTAFAEELAVAPRLVLGGETAIGDAIDFAVRLFDESVGSGGRRVIDISGDGISNRGREVTSARDDAVFVGITINGVAILNEEPRLDAYYKAFVVGGTGAFALAARDYEDFRDVIIKKLVREITTIAAAQ